MMTTLSPSEAFYGPFLKIERAEHHIGNLETIFRDFTRNNMQRLRPKNDNRSLKKARLRSFPKHTPTVLGDAVHNLHAALDYAYHVVCNSNDATFSEYRRFPFGEDRKSLEGSINGHKKAGIGPSDKVISVILDEIQPYDGGKFGLYGLHTLDITDKHLVLIPTSGQMSIQRLDITTPEGAPSLTIEGITLIQEGADKGGEFINVGRNSGVLQGNPKDAFAIVFKNGQPFEGQSILDVMRSLRDATRRALDLLKDAS